MYLHQLLYMQIPKGERLATKTGTRCFREIGNAVKGITIFETIQNALDVKNLEIRNGSLSREEIGSVQAADF